MKRVLLIIYLFISLSGICASQDKSDGIYKVSIRLFDGSKNLDDLTFYMKLNSTQSKEWDGMCLQPSIAGKGLRRDDFIGKKIDIQDEILAVGIGSKCTVSLKKAESKNAFEAVISYQFINLNAELIKRRGVASNNDNTLTNQITPNVIEYRSKVLIEVSEIKELLSNIVKNTINSQYRLYLKVEPRTCPVPFTNTIEKSLGCDE